jgi:TRAP-type C4-dicarboxylate transport system substrate-binding protein
MNGEAWKSLTPELQKVVQDCANEAIAYCNGEAEKREQDSINKMKAEGAVIHTLTNVAEWQEKVRPATTVMENNGMWRKGLYNEIQQIK